VSPLAGRNCEALLNVLNGKVQLLLDHLQSLEDRIHHVESGAGAAGSTSEGVEVINAGSVSIDHGARRVFVGHREVPLSPTEYRLIYQLAKNSGKVVLHRDLLRRAFSHGEVNPGNLKVYIGRLRAKLNSGHDAACDLKAVRGVGYRLSA
jgi:DNA-binding response OmpR family regulator